MAAVKSSDTKRPIWPDFRMFSRTSSRRACVGSKSAGMTLPPANPSSTISMKRTLGVKIERTPARSTPSMKKTSSVTCFRVSKNSGVKISPSVARKAISTRLAPPNCSWYCRKVCI